MLPEFDELVKEIKSMREDLGWSQKKLANRTGVSQSSVAKLEQKTNIPNYKTTRKIYNKLRENMNKKEENAADLLNPEIVSVKPTDTREKAARIMEENDFSQLPVKKDNDFIGIVLSKDIGLIDDETPVKEIMRKTIPTVPQNTTRKALAKLLETNNALLIKQKNKTKGIITPADLL